MEYLEIVIEDLERRTAEAIRNLGGKLPPANYPVSPDAKDEIDSGRVTNPYNGDLKCLTQ